MPTGRLQTVSIKPSTFGLGTPQHHAILHPRLCTVLPRDVTSRAAEGVHLEQEGRGNRQDAAVQPWSEETGDGAAIGLSW